MERARKRKGQRKISMETEKLVVSESSNTRKRQVGKYLYNVNTRHPEIKFARGKAICNNTFVLLLISLLKTVTNFHSTFPQMSKGLEQN